MVCEWLSVEEGAVVGKAGRSDGACKSAQDAAELGGRERLLLFPARAEGKGCSRPLLASPGSPGGGRGGALIAAILHLSMQQLHLSVQQLRLCMQHAQLSTQRLQLSLAAVAPLFTAPPLQ